jgi:hypothetical protein
MEGSRFAADSMLEGDGFELPVPRHAVDLRSIPGIAAGSARLLSVSPMVQPFFFCASNHSIEPG